VVAGFDPDLFPLLMAVALEYSVPLSAEHGQVLEGAPLDIIVAPHSLERYQPFEHQNGEGKRSYEFGPLWEGSGAVRFTQLSIESDSRGRVPLTFEALHGREGGRYGVAIWPHSASEADVGVLLETSESAVLLRPGKEASGPWGEFHQRSLDITSDELRRDRASASIPYSFLMQRILDNWLDRRQ
jgi:hypothetical protein